MVVPRLSHRRKASARQRLQVVLVAAAAAWFLVTLFHSLANASAGVRVGKLADAWPDMGASNVNANVDVNVNVHVHSADEGRLHPAQVLPPLVMPAANSNGRNVSGKSNASGSFSMSKTRPSDSSRLNNQGVHTPTHVVLGSVQDIVVDHDLYPLPPKKFTPQIFDGDGIPNVVHGCGNAIDASYRIEIHVRCTSFWKHISFWKHLQQVDMTNWTLKTPHEITLYVYTPSDDIPVPSRTDYWKHGPMFVQTIDIHSGTAEAAAAAKGNTTDWFDVLGHAAQSAGENTLLVTLSDRIKLSPFYLQYIDEVAYNYARQPRCRDSNLFGISLSTADVKAPGVGREHHSVFLAAFPATESAAYWSDQFVSFYQFVKIRRMVQVPSPFMDINKVKNMHKHMLSEFLFARGLVILFPTPQIATTNSSAHVIIKWPPDFHMPPYGDIAVLDHLLQLSSKEVLLAKGTHYLNSVGKHCTDCEDFLTTWGRPGWKNASTWKNFNPLLCVADAYSSTALMSMARPTTTQSKSDSHTTRYLMFEPQYGTNNQVHAIMEAYYWAKVLGRRLVIPPLLTPRVSHYNDGSNRSHWLDFSNFYRLLPMNTNVLFGSDFKPFQGHDLSPISFLEFEKLQLRPWRFLRLTRHTPFDPSSRVLSQSMGLSTNDEIVNLKHLFNKVVRVDSVQHMLGGCHDQVLAFDSIYFALLKEADPRSQMKKTLALTESVLKQVQAVQQALHSELGSAKYSCYHVRQGDFAKMCPGIENPTSYKNVEISDWLKENAQEYQCLVGNDDLKAALQIDPRPALILSDNPKALQDAIDSSPNKAVTSSWVYNVTKATSKMTGNNLDILSLIIDQTLCVEADVAILNRFSTVSQRVANSRNEKGVKYWKKQNN